MREPATQAVRKHAIEPAIYALKARRAKSCLRSGANVENAEICIPTDAGLLKPHSA